MCENAGLYKRFGRVIEKSLHVTQAIALDIAIRGKEGVSDRRVVLEEPRWHAPRASHPEPVTASRPVDRPLPPSRNNGTELLP